MLKCGAAHLFNDASATWKLPAPPLYSSSGKDKDKDKEKVKAWVGGEEEGAALIICPHH